jgi:hypothetical protein
MFYEQVVSFSFLYILATAQETSENHNLRHATLLYTRVATELMDHGDPKELTKCNYCLFVGEAYIMLLSDQLIKFLLLMTFTLFGDAS